MVRACMKNLTLALLGLGLCAGCEQAPDLVPRPERVSPARVPAGQQHYVVIEGHFPPLVGWDLNSEPEVITELEVRIDGVRADAVRRAGRDRLVVRTPALSAGCHDVLVTRSGGLEGRLSQGLCAAEVASLHMVHGCILQGVGSLCTSELIDGQAQAVQSLVQDALPLAHLEAGLFQADSSLAAYAVSMDGSKLAYLRFSPPAGEGFDGEIQLRVAHLGEAQLGESSWEISLATVAQPPEFVEPEDESLSFYGLSGLAFSPDGRFLTWVRDHRLVMVSRVPGGSQDKLDPIELASVPADAGQRLLAPDIDVTSRFVLYTWVSSDRLLAGAPNQINVFRVPIDGGDPPEALFPEEEAHILNGPGAFHPDGGRVIFVSDRLQMEIFTPFGSMAKVINLYALDLNSRQVTALTSPTAGLWLGRPKLSPDGRTAANIGFIADDTFSFLDLFAVDLGTGSIERVGEDEVPFCYPPQEASCIPGSLHGCCSGADCCSFQNLGACPSWELLSSFSPDSQRLAINYAPLVWYCFDDGFGGGVWDSGMLDYRISLSQLQPGTDWLTDDLDGAIYNWGEYSFGPSFLQRLNPQ